MKWVGEQKQFQTQKILEKIQKGKNQNKYTQKCLQLCKSWKGPVTSVEELANPDKVEKIVWMELTYYRDTHKSDIVQQPDLFKINKIVHEEQLLNLCALLSGQDPMSGFVTLPSNSEAEKVLSSSETLKLNEDDDAIQVGMNYVTLFLEGDLTTWYISSCTKQNDDGPYTMDHLHQLHNGSNLKRKHPAKTDTDNLKAESIVECH